MRNQGDAGQAPVQYMQCYNGGKPVKKAGDCHSPGWPAARRRTEPNALERLLLSGGPSWFERAQSAGKAGARSSGASTKSTAGAALLSRRTRRVSDHSLSHGLAEAPIVHPTRLPGEVWTEHQWLKF